MQSGLHLLVFRRARRIRSTATRPSTRASISPAPRVEHVVAVAAGVVTWAGERSGYGNAGRDQPRQWLRHPLRPQPAHAGGGRPDRDPRPAGRADGLHGPLHRSPRALRSAAQRAPGRSRCPSSAAEPSAPPCRALIPAPANQLRRLRRLLRTIRRFHGPRSYLSTRCASRFSPGRVPCAAISHAPFRQPQRAHRARLSAATVAPGERSSRPRIKALSDEALRAKTDEFRARLKEGATLDDLLPEAFAVVREAARRTLKMRHFDVQLIGGIDAAPGEDRRDAHRRGQDAGGDAARLPECAAGRGRARRHRERIPGAARRGLDGPGVPLPRPHRRRHQERAELRRRSAPPTPATSPTAPTTNSASTTCATTSPSGSRTACSAASSFAIVDEVDSILIDEARTPLIISGPAEESTELYLRINQLVPRLTRQKEEERPRRLLGGREEPSRCTSPKKATSTSSS